jgi:hypothetical protein
MDEYESSQSPSSNVLLYNKRCSTITIASHGNNRNFNLEPTETSMDALEELLASSYLQFLPRAESLYINQRKPREIVYVKLACV